MVLPSSIAKIIASIVGYSYPAYASFKAIGTPTPDDDKQWLTYWIVLGAWTTGEPFADTFLSWFPFYWEMKIAGLILLQHPKIRGAEFIYNNFLAPWLKENEKFIDKKIAEGQATAETYVKSHLPDAEALTATATHAVISTVNAVNKFKASENDKDATSTSSSSS